MDVSILLETSVMAPYLESNIALGDAVAQFLPPILICLAVALMVRRQIGGGWIALGVALLLSRELFCFFTFQSGVFTVLQGFGLSSVCPFLYGTLIVGYGLVGIGLMQPHQSRAKNGSRTARWLNVLLFVSITIELTLLINRLSMDNGPALLNWVQEAFHLISLTLLIIVVGVRHVYHSKLSQEADDGQRQLDAMISMFSAVKHDLNNDMQVVVGNAELAENLISSGGDIQKPVSNITNAASIAIERIAQLSVFNSTAKPLLSAVDLNSTLRESMARLINEIPAIVTVKMELEHLPIRVMADRYLLSLSLMHMIKQSVKNMQHGGEIVIRTQDLSATKKSSDSTVVNAEVFIVRALGLPVGGSKSTRRKPVKSHAKVKSEFEGEFNTLKSLFERSGAVSVAHSLSPNEFGFSMQFNSEAAAESISPSIALGQSYV